MAHSRKWLHRDLEDRLGLRVLTLLLYDENNQRWDLGLSERDTRRLGPGEALQPRTTLRTLPRAIRKAIACASAIRRDRANAVVVNGYNYVECWLLLAWCRCVGVPALLATDSNLASDAHAKSLARTWRGAMRARRKSVLVRLASRLARGVLPLGAGGVAYFERYGVPSSKMFIVPLGNDPELTRPVTSEERAGVLSSFGIAPGERVVLCSGRLADVKSWDVAIDAFARIAPHRPGWVLAFAGDGPLREALQARARAALGEASGPSVRWLGQVADPRRNFDLIRSIDVLLHPAAFEPWGMVVQEGVLAGKPVVVSAVTGAALDLVRDGVGGRIVRAGDVEAFAQALLETTGDDALPRLARGALATARDWERTNDRCAGMHAALASVGVQLPQPLALRAGVDDRGTIEVVSSTDNLTKTPSPTGASTGASRSR
jgi:glycosyltransferase involved in cell wall biosynthesis